MFYKNRLFIILIINYFFKLLKNCLSIKIIILIKIIIIILIF